MFIYVILVLVVTLLQFSVFPAFSFPIIFNLLLALAVSGIFILKSESSLQLTFLAGLSLDLLSNYHFGLITFLFLCVFVILGVFKRFFGSSFISFLFGYLIILALYRAFLLKVPFSWFLLEYIIGALVSLLLKKLLRPDFSGLRK